MGKALLYRFCIQKAVLHSLTSLEEHFSLSTGYTPPT